MVIVNKMEIQKELRYMEYWKGLWVEKTMTKEKTEWKITKKFVGSDKPINQLLKEWFPNEYEEYFVNGSCGHLKDL